MGPVQDQPGQNPLQQSPCRYLAKFMPSMVHHSPHHSQPTARLGAVGAHCWSGKKAGVWADPVQPRMVAAVTAHEPAQGGCPAAGAPLHCSTEGCGGLPVAVGSCLDSQLWPPHPGSQPWPRVPCPAGWVAIAKLQCGTGTGHGEAKRRHMQQGSAR